MTAMRVALGTTGIETSMLALGCARIGSALTPLDRRQSLALIHEAYESGIRHFDTASIYGQGDSERYLGDALRGRRSEVCLASKAGQRLTPRQRLLASFKAPIRMLATHRAMFRQHVAAQRGRGVARCFEPDYIARSLEATLRRLGVDHLDVFYLHSPDAQVLADAPLMARIAALQKAGRFRVFGVSCDEPEVARAAARIDAVQVVQFSFEGSDADQALLGTLASQGKTAVLRGFVSPAAPGLAQGADLSERFSRALVQPAVGGIVVGTTNPAHLRENVAALARAMQGGRQDAAAA